MKGHPQSNCGGGGGSGGGWMIKKKTVMVAMAVAILMGVLGVMMVQRVKDRRLFNLVIKDKDSQILSLNLHLQKERQYAKEHKRKNQDLNAKLYSLRTQKIELNNKIMEMRSTIGSMKDEQRALELAIDEKQNEIKHKESEIKDLKTNHQTQPKIWPVSPNDPSNQRVNLTTKVEERGPRFGQSSNGQKPKHQIILNPDPEVQKTKDEDSEKLAGSKDHSENAKIETHNNTNGTVATKEKQDSEENENNLAMKGRRFYIGATESQRDESNGQSEKSQLTANQDEGPTEVITQFKSSRTKGEADRMDEDEAETEVDKISSRNGSEEDQDYKEETEE